uniref:Opsin n=1 Tax=Nematostella vectensis TaxID=45351 RepID=A9UMZ2_NEMVE|nr:TPA: opsin [Nematostella vectensis]
MVGLSGTSYNAYAVGILLILLTGVGTNGCLLFFLFRNKQSRQRVLTPYLVGISAANSTMIETCLPITFTNAMSHRWLFNDVVCRVEGFIAGTAAISMMLTLACIVYKVHKGMTHILVRNRALYKRSRRPWGLIAGVWLASAVTMLPPLTGVTSMTYEAGQTNCAPNWRPEDTRDIIYAVSLTTIVFIVPMSACIFYLVRIRVTLSRLHVHQSRPRSRFALAYKGITKMVGVSVAMYVVTWMPYCVCVFVSLCGGASLLRSPSVTFIPHLIAKSSFLWMPIIYFLLYNRFKNFSSTSSRASTRKPREASYQLNKQRKSIQAQFTEVCLESAMVGPTRNPYTASPLDLSRGALKYNI